MEASDLDRHVHDMTCWGWGVAQRTYEDSVPVTSVAAAVVTQKTPQHILFQLCLCSVVW